jgi:arabinogalactan endo-1,4-beta-galactosidase
LEETLIIIHVVSGKKKKHFSGIFSEELRWEKDLDILGYSFL